MRELPPLRYRRLWTSLGLLGLAMILVLSLVAIEPRVVAFSWQDKLEHFLAWGLLLFWFASIWPDRVPLLFAILLTLSVGVEFAQALTTWRQGSLGDGVANLAGLLAGGVLAAINRSRIILRLDNKLHRYRDS